MILRFESASCEVGWYDDYILSISYHLLRCHHKHVKNCCWKSRVVTWMCCHSSIDFSDAQELRVFGMLILARMLLAGG